MKHNKDQTEPNSPDEQKNDRPTGKISEGDTQDTMRDSSVRHPSWEVQPVTEDELGELEFQDCVEMIGRVREHSPECLEDWMTSKEGDPNATHPQPWDVGLPQRLGRFELQEVVGQGGFGIVYKALDAELGRSVALKVPRLETLLSESDRFRFLQEARAMCRLDHPHLATIFEAGREGHIYYIASQFYGGGTLADFLDRRTTVSDRQAAELIKTLAEAVQHVHSRGILHRDIKPTNVLFDQPDSADKGVDTTLADGTQSGQISTSLARLTDFGLARMLDVSDRQTKSGALLGTPSYMSPEQAESRTDDIGVTTDVYALGAILYHLLCGRPPHEGDSLVATLDAVRNTNPIPPRKLKPSISVDLEAICLKCLHTEQQLRYPTAQALADDLERWLSGQNVLARHASSLERMQRWCRRNPAWSLLVATVVLALMSTSVISSLAYLHVRETNQALIESNTALEVARAQEARRTSQLRDSLDAQVSVVLEDILMRSYQLTDAHREYLEKTIESYETFTKDQGDRTEDRISATRAFVRIGEIRNRLGETEQAIEAYRSALERYAQLIRQDESNSQLVLERAKALGGLAAIYKDRQELQEARRLLNEAAGEVESLLRQEPTKLEYVRSWIEKQAVLAYVEKSDGKLARAQELVRNALHTGQEHLDPSEPDDKFVLCKLRGTLAQLLFPDRDFSSIEQLLNESNGTIEGLLELDPDNPAYLDDAASNLNMLGLLYLSTGRMKTAQATLTELIQIRQLLADRFPANVQFLSEYVVAINNFGSVLMQTGEPMRAESLWKAGFEAAERLVALDPDDPYSRAQLAALTFHLAQRRLDQDEAEAAATLAEQGEHELQLALAANANNPQFMQVVNEHHVVLARLYSAKGQHEDALQEAAFLQEHPFHPIEAPILVARIQAKAALRYQELGSVARSDELKFSVRETLQDLAVRGFDQWDSIEQDPAMEQLFTAEEFVAIRASKQP